MTASNQRRRCSDMASRREALTVVALCVAWYALSSASNVVAKLAMAQLPFPMTVTLVQLGGTVVLSAPALALFGVPAAPSFPREVYLYSLLPLAAAKFLTTVLSQVSIWKVPISYAHTVKATTPLWTCVLARVLLGERQPRGVLLALLVIAAGVAVASATELQFDAVGLGAALAAAALLALQHLYSKRAMLKRRMHHLRLLQLVSQLALVLLLPLWAWADARALRSVETARWRAGGALLAAGGALAWLQAVAAFSVLWRVSPLTYGVASAAKRAAVVAASLLVMRNPASPLNVAGMALAAVGVLLYDRARAPTAAARPARAPLLPV